MWRSSTGEGELLKEILLAWELLRLLTHTAEAQAVGPTVRRRLLTWSYSFEFDCLIKRDQILLFPLSYAIQRCP